MVAYVLIVVLLAQASAADHVNQQDLVIQGPGWVESLQQMVMGVVAAKTMGEPVNAWAPLANTMLQFATAPASSPVPRMGSPQRRVDPSCSDGPEGNAAPQSTSWVRLAPESVVEALMMVTVGICYAGSTGLYLLTVLLLGTLWLCLGLTRVLRAVVSGLRYMSRLGRGSSIDLASAARPSEDVPLGSVVGKKVSFETTPGSLEGIYSAPEFTTSGNLQTQHEQSMEASAPEPEEELGFDGVAPNTAQALLVPGLARVVRSGKYRGHGYAVLEQDPIYGNYLRHVRNPRTGVRAMLAYLQFIAAHTEAVNAGSRA